MVQPRKDNEMFHFHSDDNLHRFIADYIEILGDSVVRIRYRSTLLWSMAIGVGECGG